MGTPTERILELETQLAAATTEVKNCHILLAILAERAGGVVITDEEMQSVGSLGVLTVLRDDRIPGCSILLKPHTN